MKFVSSVCSDAGIVKQVNQDAALVRQARTKRGTVLFAVICDGMGGLEQGEVASSTVVSGMSDWFEEIFPDILYHDFTPERIRSSWQREITRLNSMICSYGKEKGTQLGTTLVTLLLVENVYYICNVGDSRIYYLKDGIRQVTKDQSYVQREMDQGRMTEEESKTSSRRHILLQCIGTGRAVRPDFYIGEYQRNASFLLCSDGFRNVLTKQEMWSMLRPESLPQEQEMLRPESLPQEQEMLRPESLPQEQEMLRPESLPQEQKTLRPENLSGQRDMDRRLKQLVETVKDRQEEDNITAVWIHVI